jgi:hypothetical protein
MEELFDKLQKKEEAIAKLEFERRRGRTTPATDIESTSSNQQSTHTESPAADGSVASGACIILADHTDSPAQYLACLHAHVATLTFMPALTPEAPFFSFLILLPCLDCLPHDLLLVTLLTPLETYRKHLSISAV